ncbi:ABC transporter G family member 20 isoform X2 [Monomorium pharaonis]|nr:ABC transporter G family member 20 isoform X2 [Monomorium pharaonis]XP_012522410.1 ABC transporter G family member 20 isoform X2 [Monomorium pharaonis]XP_012522411.1 ABC transporter G family member 20 isoform X2 [Monomorium pharaonis]XP_012522412.1 ABC transporter G family member 20 isoform X2 [Monomorium pharaonis]XP_036142809.1 ABC transporter G family member 20 isoform X2 [Monomorium pharaonis]XP_036142815.1 ABC transporter G family member 20 isoform X2 [Monomorium pharaonis]
MVQQEAVVVRNAIKRYGKKQLVLNGLNMTVAKGSIYGLLGASGCGKTTLLSCVVGVQHLSSGKIWVLGGTPGSKGSGIPGPRVGYMPQNISLVGEFSVNDAFYYFGRINGVDDDEIEKRQTFFSELLQLPPANRLIKNMSGGQQRRVSFAAALIHKPELLILDEPTVGLDPVLRDNIWTYMLKITQEENITVLITTHYIEETKDANKIGLMRGGKLLAESHPRELLEQFQCSLLEEAFLKMCQTQDNASALNKRHQESRRNTNESSDVLHQDYNQYQQTKEISEYKAIPERRVSRLKRLKALLAKNGIQFLRYYTGLFFAVIFPIQMACMFLSAVGGDPKDIKIGVINDEAGNCDFGSNLGNVWNDKIVCHFGNLSCKFLHSFDDFMMQEHYDNFSEANLDVQNGKLRGIIYFSQNFSEGLQIRGEEAVFTKDSDLYASQIQVFLDMSDRIIGLFMQQKLMDHFFDTYEDIMRDCKYPIKLANPPIRFEDPIYGTMDQNYRDFMIPGYMLSLALLLAMSVSTTLLITDRLEGVWDRSLVQGVKTEEILLSHILIQGIIIVIHAIVITLITFAIWGVESKGSIIIISFFIFLNGFCGLMFGFIISVVCKNHSAAHYASTGSFFPLIVLNGSIWPLEGMPKLLRWFSYALPTTTPSISVRALIYKGYSIFDWQIYSGLLVSLGWILFYFIVTVIRLRQKSS